MSISDSNTRQRIAIIRFLMVCGIVILHTPQYVDIATLGSGWFDLTKAYFQSAVFRCSVPTLTCISGYLLFSAGRDTSAIALFKMKFRTLVVPFLVFNTLLAVAIFAVEGTTKLPISYQLHPFDATTMLDAAFGWTKAPINYPLNFLRDLIVLMLLAPLFGWMIRRAAFSGLVALTIIMIWNLDGALILRNEMALMFYIGGVAAVKQWNLRTLDRHAGLCLAVFLALCAAVIFFRVGNTTYLRLVAPVLIWPASALLVHTRAGKWFAQMSGYSFFIFLCHAPVLLGTWMVYKTGVTGLPYEAYWLLAPVVTVTFLIGTHQLMTNSMPNLFASMAGGSRRYSARVQTMATAAPVSRMAA